MAWSVSATLKQSRLRAYHMTSPTPSLFEFIFELTYKIHLCTIPPDLASRPSMLRLASSEGRGRMQHNPCHHHTSAICPANPSRFYARQKFSANLTSMQLGSFSGTRITKAIPGMEGTHPSSEMVDLDWARNTMNRSMYCRRCSYTLLHLATPAMVKVCTCFNKREGRM